MRRRSRRQLNDDFSWVGCQREKCRVGESGEAFPPPARDVGHNDVFPKVQLGFVENPPAAGAAASLTERAMQLSDQRRSHVSVPGSRSRRDEKLAVENFGDEMLGHAT